MSSAAPPPSVTDDRPAPPQSPPPPAGPTLWGPLQPLVMRLHFYAGILVGPFLFVAATTGLVYSVSPQRGRLAPRAAARRPGRCRDARP